MGKKYISISLFLLLNSLSFSGEKKWVNKKEFQVIIEKLIRNCINYEKRLLKEGKSVEEATIKTLKTHDSYKISKLRKINPQFEGIILLAFKKAQE